MSTLAIKNKIYDKLKSKFDAATPLTKDIKDLFTAAKKKIVLFYAGDEATPDNATNMRFKNDFDFQILIDTRNLKSDDEALELRDKIVSAINGLKVNETDSYNDRIYYKASRFEEFAQGTGIWTHKLFFTTKRDLFIAEENL